jgi:hypothetical protein
MSSWANLRSQAEVDRTVALAVPCGVCQMVIFYYRGPRPQNNNDHMKWGKYLFAGGPHRGEKATAKTARFCVACGTDLTSPRVLYATFDPRRWHEIRLETVPTTPTGVGWPLPSVGPVHGRRRRPPPPPPDDGGGGGDGGEPVPPRTPPPSPTGDGAVPELPAPRATIYEILPGMPAPPAVYEPRPGQERSR